MERPIEHAVLSIERVLRLAAHSPFFAKRNRTASEVKDNQRLVNALKNHLEHLGIAPAEALTVDISDSERKISVHSEGFNRYGQKIGIDLTVSLESND